MDKQTRQIKNRVTIMMHRVRMMGEHLDKPESMQSYLDCETVLAIIKDGYHYDMVLAVIEATSLVSSLEVLGEKYLPGSDNRNRWRGVLPPGEGHG